MSEAWRNVLPGDPTPAQLAGADRKYAATRVALTRLVERVRGDLASSGAASTDLVAWLEVVAGPCLEAALPLAINDKGRDDMMAVLGGLLGEAVLRLARARHGLVPTPVSAGGDGLSVAWCFCGEQFRAARLGDAHDLVRGHVERMTVAGRKQAGS